MRARVTGRAQSDEVLAYAPRFHSWQDYLPLPHLPTGDVNRVGPHTLGAREVDPPGRHASRQARPVEGPARRHQDLTT